MRKFILALGLITGGSLTADQSDQMNSWEQDNYAQSLRQEIQKQQDLVNSLKNQIIRKDVIMPGAINNQFENAYTMLNVKQTLFNNFIGTPSIQSPLVQAKLLEIFRKDLISPGDLSELEVLVQQERPKYLKQTTGATTGATAAAAPTPMTVPK